MEDRVSRATCERGNDLIAFLYGEVAEREALDFERHLQGCSNCKEELGAFRQLRESVIAWRQESLSAVPAKSVESSSAVVSSSFRNFEPRKPSAVAAIRAFLDLSPLWTKGAVAFAATLFCVVSLFAVVRFLEKPQLNFVSSDKLYTEQELNARIEQGVQAKLQAGKDEVSPPLVVASDKRRGESKRAQSLAKFAAVHPKAQRRPLTRSEREQLAADLRLISPNEEEDLELVSDRINN